MAFIGGRAMTPDQPHPVSNPVQPVPPQLDDGFSPPAATVQARQADDVPPATPVDPALWAKSDF
jgi:hypothetical protein